MNKYWPVCCVNSKNQKNYNVCHSNLTNCNTFKESKKPKIYKNKDYIDRNPVTKPEKSRMYKNKLYCCINFPKIK